MIHHATKAKAEKENVTLTEGFDEEDNILYEAECNQTGAKLDALDAKGALAAVLLERTFRLEYPVLSLERSGDNWCVTSTDGGIVYSVSGEVPSLLDVLEAAREEGIDPEAEFEEEDEQSGVVVAQKYKEKWAEEGHPNHCGDWLAEKLEGEFETVEDGRIVFDWRAFAAMLEENGVEMVGKWADLPHSGQKGWQGRYRMNGRQKLERILLDTKVLKIRGNEHRLPNVYVSYLRERHPEVTKKKAA